MEYKAIYSSSTSLSHYGVLGMKWGHRKYKAKSKLIKDKEKSRNKLQRASKKSKNHTKKAKTYAFRAVGAAAGTAATLAAVDGVVNGISSTTLGFGTSPPKGTARRLIYDLTTKAVRGAKKLILPNPPALAAIGEGGFMVAYALAGVSAASAAYAMYNLHKYRKQKKLEKEFDLKQGGVNTMETSYLCHYGVLGMKWGHRKAQLKAAYKKTKNIKAAKKKLKTEAGSKKVEDLSKYSDADLRKMLDRARLERDYRDAVDPNRNKNKESTLSQLKKNATNQAVNKAFEVGANILTEAIKNSLKS